MSINPKISIILPNYNSSSFLKETLISIKKQSYKNWELIIVDDNSDKLTKEILRSLKKDKKMKVFYLKSNYGAGYCRNFAIKKSTSKYIAFIDSDDIWNKDKLKLQIKFMIKNKYDFTYTSYLAFKDGFNRKFAKKIVPKYKFDLNNFIKNSSIATSSIILKKNVVKGAKFTNTPILEDYFFKCQILRKIKFAYCLNNFLLFYRVRKNSLQSNKFKNIYWLWFINKKYNKLNLVDNIISILSISANSIKKYGFK